MSSLRLLVRRLAPAATALALSGCISLGPKYQRPEVAVPPAYQGEAPGAAPVSGSVPDKWWTAFGEPALDALVEEALTANQDLAAAAARVEEARALFGEARSNRYPEITADLGGSRTKLSSVTSQLPPGFPLELPRVDGTLNLSYEFDFWGRLARSSEAARAELLATEEGRRNVRLGLTADVVTAYFDLQSLDRQMAITEATIASRLDSVNLQQLRYDSGTISELDLAQAQAESAAAEAAAPEIERQTRFTEHRLAVLLGRMGGAIARPRGTTDATDAGAANNLSAAGAAGDAAAQVPAKPLPEVPVGLPSELLARRPDVVAAEHKLIAANARIAVARAGYFPSISLTGYGGSESKELSGLFAAGTNIWQVALGLVQPIFQAGKVTRQVEAAHARQRQAVAAYLKSVESAFADVEDALSARSTGTRARQALERQAAALARASQLARLRYEAGDSSYLEVLDAERNLFGAQLAVSGARRLELGAAVALFKALGGGWEQPAAAAPATPVAAQTQTP